MTLAIVAIGLVLAGVRALVVYRKMRRVGYFNAFAGRVPPFSETSRLLATPSGLWLGMLSLVIWILDGSVWWLVAVSLDLPLGSLRGSASP